MHTPSIVLLATQNEKKRKELVALADGAFVVRVPSDVGLGDVDVEESGETFDENASLKARGFLAAWHARSSAPPPFDFVIADDSGIVVDVLDGAPGVRSARFARDHGAGSGDADNNALLLAKLHDVDDARRTARFVCHVAILAVEREELVIVRGVVEGKVARDARGEGGFGYDPLFIPDAHPSRRVAELTADEKHAISHRGHAMRAAVRAINAKR